MTVKENILFGKPFDKKKYEEVISSCALLADLEVLPNGDETEIGENGVNLSGGQKQRVSLARAAYHEADIVLLDDPLSSVDSGVSKFLFDNLIGNTGLLKNSTRLLVTHNLSYLHKVDNILVMSEGRIIEQGGLEQLQADNSSAFQEFSDFISKNTKAEENCDEKSETQEKNEKISKTSQDDKKGKLTTTEVKEEGRVDWRHYQYYIKSMTVWKFVWVCFLFLVAEAFKVGGNVILAEWTKNYDPDRKWSFIGYYTLLAVGCSGAGMWSQMGCQFIAAEASRKIHLSLLDKTLHAPMIFFETTPTGRILNRFSSDLDMIGRQSNKINISFFLCRRKNSDSIEELPELLDHDLWNIRCCVWSHSLVPDHSPAHHDLLRLPASLLHENQETSVQTTGHSKVSNLQPLLRDNQWCLDHQSFQSTRPVFPGI